MGEITYVDAHGSPVLFCVIANRTADAPVRSERRHNLSLASWSRDGRGYPGDWPECRRRRAAELARTLEKRVLNSANSNVPIGPAALKTRDPSKSFASDVVPGPLQVRTKSSRCRFRRSEPPRTGALAIRLGGEPENRSGSHSYRVCDRRGWLFAQRRVDSTAAIRWIEHNGQKQRRVPGAIGVG